MNKNMVMAAILMVLVVVSAVQAFQLNELKDKVASGKISKSVSAPVSSSTGGSGDLNELPAMVGGC